MKQPTERISQRDADYADALRRLVLLLEKKPLSAIQIAAEMSCGKPTVYRRLQALRAQGVGLKVRKVQGASGPPARVYQVVWKQGSKEAKK